jgi:hypothetical protein
MEVIMHLPFTTEAFLDIFARYNTAIWPTQIVAYLLGVLAIVAAMRRFRGSDRLIGAILVILWLWVGAVYHLVFFRQINPAAALFGVFFIVQGGLFLVSGMIRQQLVFHLRADSAGWTGGLLMLYAMVIYPILGSLFGHVYPHTPTFGVTPCPLVIFTFGLLLVTSRRLPAYLLIIPSLWALLGLSAATVLGIRQDLGLIVSAVITIIMLAVRNRRAARTPEVPDTADTETAASQ